MGLMKGSFGLWEREPFTSGGRMGLVVVRTNCDTHPDSLVIHNPCAAPAVFWWTGGRHNISIFFTKYCVLHPADGVSSADQWPRQDGRSVAPMVTSHGLMSPLGAAPSPVATG